MVEYSNATPLISPKPPIFQGIGTVNAKFKNQYQEPVVTRPERKVPVAQPEGLG